MTGRVHPGPAYWTLPSLRTIPHALGESPVLGGHVTSGKLPVWISVFLSKSTSKYLRYLSVLRWHGSEEFDFWGSHRVITTQPQSSENILQLLKPFNHEREEIQHKPSSPRRPLPATHNPTGTHLISMPAYQKHKSQHLSSWSGSCMVPFLRYLYPDLDFWKRKKSKGSQGGGSLK